MKQLLLLWLLLIHFFPKDGRENTIDPTRYLPILTFDGKDGFDKGETCFPIAFDFNATQDANGDGKINAEDNLENLIPFSIGKDVKGTGRSGLKDRGPNDQRPAVYFHHSASGKYEVYEYWFYYADNDWINNHEHDWEKYFVYELNGQPEYIFLSRHSSFDRYKWKKLWSNGGHPEIGVHRGSHAMSVKREDGVRIEFNGEISMRNGDLTSGDGQIIHWMIYSNDAAIMNAKTYLQTPDTFYYGDPHYRGNRNENGDERPAPWKRKEWDSPPAI